jgi:hypothetical protein
MWIYVKYFAYIAGAKDTGPNAVTLKVYDYTTTSAFSDTAATTALDGSSYPVIPPVSSLSDAVARGDQLAIQVMMPSSWSTQPTNVAFAAQATCK